MIGRSAHARSRPPAQSSAAEKAIIEPRAWVGWGATGPPDTSTTRHLPPASRRIDGRPVSGGVDGGSQLGRGGLPPCDAASAAIAGVLAELASRLNCEPTEEGTVGERSPRPRRPAGDPAVRKGYATFYTREPIAYLLAFLAIHSPGDGWPPDLAGGLRVCDFSCGEGILLSASLAALRTLSRLAHRDRSGSRREGESKPDVCLWGFDASEDAIRAAGQILYARASGLPARVILRHLPLDESGSLGSLDLWWGSGARGHSPEDVRVPRFDLVIMNPPFSRTTAPGRSGSRPRIFDYATTSEGFRRLWSEYTRLVRDVEAEAMKREGVRRVYGALVGERRPFGGGCVDPIRAGAALPFFFLADRYLRPGGRVALVLPRAALEGAAYLLMRAALVTGYHIECIVVPSGGESLSRSTQLSEVLLVARKLGNGEGEVGATPRPPTTVVILRRRPETPLVGALLATEVVRLLSEGAQGVARVGRSEAEVRLVGGELVKEFAWNLSPILGLPQMVERLVLNMAEGRLLGLRVRLTTLGDAPGLGVTNPRRFRGREFSSRFALSPEGALMILSSAGREAFGRLEFDPCLAQRISPKSADAERFYRERGGRLLVPEAVRFDSMPLVATWSSRVIASSRAHMVRMDPRRERALCAWLNSTFAVAWLRAMFTTVEGAFGHIYAWHLRAARVPDLGDPEVVERLDSVFQRYAEATWPPLPEQYREAGRGEAERLEYDLDVLRALAAASGTHLDEEEARARLKPLYSEILEVL